MKGFAIITAMGFYSYHWVRKFNYQKAVSVSLTFFLIFQIIAGTLVPFKFSLNPPHISLQEAKAAGEGWLSGWQYRKELIIDETKIDADLTDFPVLVKLSAGNFDFSKARSDGYDIRFTSSDGITLLKYERERHVQATSLAEYWVKVPAVSGTVNTDFYIYYGKSDAIDGADPTAVWDTNAKAVWHKKDITTSTINDSTTNVNHGAKKAANEPVEADGKIGKGQNYDGTNDYVSFGTGGAMSGAGTIEFWMSYLNLGHTADRLIIVKRSDNGAQTNYQISVGGPTSPVAPGKLLFFHGSSQTYWNYTVPTNGFHYYVIVRSSSTTMDLYVDGVYHSTIVRDWGAYTGVPLYMGGHSPMGGYYIGALLDEVAVYNVALSSAWIKANYNSGNDTLLSFEAEEYFDHFIITGVATMTAGGSQIITITAKTNLGATYTTYTSDKSLTFSGASISGNGNSPTCSDKTGVDANFGDITTITFASGVATSTMKLYKTETVSIDVTDSTVNSFGDNSYDLDVAVSSSLSGMSILINNNESYINSATATFTLAATNANQMKFSNDNITYSIYETYGTSKSWNITDANYGGNSSEGAKTVYVKYKDAYGNESAAWNDNIIYDITAPTNPNVAIDEQGAVSDTWQNNKNDPNFTSFIGESDTSGIAGFYVYFGTDSAGVTTDWITTDAFNPSLFSTSNARYLRVITKDNAGNWATGWITIFIHKYDIDAPNTPSPVASPISWTNTNIFDFSWSNPGDVGGSGVKDYTYQTNAGAPLTTTASLSITGLASDSAGTKLFSVKTNDNAGNSGATGTVNFYYDNTAPTNTGTATDNNGSLNNTWSTVSDPNFTWEMGNDVHSGVKEYDVYWGTDPAGTAVTAMVSANAYNPSAIPVNAPYYLRIKTRDNALNESVWETKFIMKYSQAASSPSGLSQTANSQSLAFSGWTNDTAPTLNFTLSDPDGDTLGYVIKIDDTADFSSLVVHYTYSANDLTSGAETIFTVGQANGTGSYTVGSQGQTLSEGQYYWKIQARESHELASSEVTANNGAVAFGIDFTPPIGTTLEFGTITSSSIAATISGATDSVSGLHATPYYFENTTVGANSGWQAGTSWTSESLAVNTQYTFQVTSRDKAVNTAVTTTQNKYTLANVPASLSLTADSQTQITANWNANSNPSGTEYFTENVTAGTNSDWLTSLSWASSGLSCNTSYSFKVKARNGNGVETVFTDLASVSAKVSAKGCPGSEIPGSVGGGVPGSASGGSSIPEPRLVRIEPSGLITCIEEQIQSIVSKITPVKDISETLKPVVLEFPLPQPKSEKIKLKEIPIEELVPKDAPLTFQGKWQLLSSKPINEFVLAPLPREIRNLAEKFPELGETLKKVGITKVTDLEKLKTVKFTLPGLKEVEQMPTEIVFAKTSGELIDFNIALSVTEKGEPQQKISIISGKPLQLVVKPDKPVKSIKGYVVFKSKTPRQSSLQFLFNRLSASLIFANPVFAKPKEKPVRVEEKLVLLEFEYTDPDGDGIFTAEIQAPIIEGEYEIITVMDFEDIELGKKEIRLITVVDPEGYIYEKDKDKETRIPGATASIYWLNPKTKQYELWPAKEYQQENPQITDVRGTYSFLVPEGYYYLKVETPGYLVYDGKPFQVKEGSGIHINIELKTKFWWLKVVDWKTILLILVIVLLLYILYRNKTREKLLKSKNP